METSWKGSMPTRSINDSCFFFLTILLFDTNFFFIILPSKSFNKIEGQGLNYFSITNKPQIKKHQR